MMKKESNVISAEHVKKLRDRTGAPMLDCKKALLETQGDFEKAIDYLRKKGLSDAAKKASRVTSEGLVHAYIHGEGRIGVLVEINCETDFVARNEVFQAFVKDVAMHIAASQPLYASETEVPTETLQREKNIFEHQAKETKKPAAVIEKIVQGKIEKFYDGVCLLRQPFVKDPDKTISQLLTEVIAKVGENCTIRRFVRFQLGEGIEKKKSSFSEEVAKQLKQ